MVSLFPDAFFPHHVAWPTLAFSDGDNSKKVAYVSDDGGVGRSYAFYSRGYRARNKYVNPFALSPRRVYLLLSLLPHGFSDFHAT